MGVTLVSFAAGAYITWHEEHEPTGDRGLARRAGIQIKCAAGECWKQDVRQFHAHCDVTRYLCTDAGDLGHPCSSHQYYDAHLASVMGEHRWNIHLSPKATDVCCCNAVLLLNPDLLLALCR